MPLNEDLYGQLVHRFGAVRIANEGIPMGYTVVHNPLTGYYDIVAHETGEYYCVCCPYCDDRELGRFRLWVNHRWNTKDPQTGAFFHPLQWAICYNERCDLRDLEVELSPYLAGMELDTPVAAIKPKSFEEIELPENCDLIANLPTYHPARQYLEQVRGFSADYLSVRWGVRYCHAHNHPHISGRIITPLVRDSKTVGFQSRYVGDDVPKNEPKYFTSPGFPKRRFLYNMDTAKTYPFAVIVEGVTDVWRLGDRAVATLGKSISPEQAAISKAIWCEGALGVCLDGDAMGDMKKLRHLLGEGGAFRWGTFAVYMEKGSDPASLTYNQVWELISDAAVRDGVRLADLNESFH